MKTGLPKLFCFFLLVILVCLFRSNIELSGASSVSLSESKETIYVGQSFTLSLKSGKNELTGADWSSYDNSIATVSSNGTVKGVAAGKTNIIASFNGIDYICKVTVREVTINKTSISLLAGDTYTLKVKGSKVKKWETTDKAVVTVKNGYITAISSGTAMVIANCKNGKTYSCKIVVEDTHTKIEKYKNGKTKTRIDYNESDQVIRVRDYDKNGNLKATAEYEYTTSGKTVYSYNSKGYLKTIELLDKNDVFLQSSTYSSNKYTKDSKDPLPNSVTDYYSNGVISKETTYDSKGVIAQVKEYRESGVLLSVSKYNRQKSNNNIIEQTIYYENSEKAQYTRYKDFKGNIGFQVLETIKYYENGNEKERTRYANFNGDIGYQISNITEYYESGNAKKEISYKDWGGDIGYRVYRMAEYYDNKFIEYKEDEEDENYVSWKKSVTQYKIDKQTGIYYKCTFYSYTEFLEYLSGDGHPPYYQEKVKAFIWYDVNGEETTKTIYDYDAEGNMIRETNYSHGEIIKITEFNTTDND